MRLMNPLPPLVEEKLEDVRHLCEKYRVRKLTIFGSAVKGTFDAEKSDLDFVVEFFEEADPMVMGRRYLDLWGALMDLFAREVDLVTRRTIENPFFLKVLSLTERPLYDAA